MIQESFLRWYLPVYFAAYFGVCVAWRSISVWRQTGRSPIVWSSSNTVYDYVGRWFKLTLALVAVTVAMFMAAGHTDERLVPIPYLETGLLRCAGLGLTAFALVWTAIAQAQMGHSWRIGIDLQGSTSLVSGGLFSHSRNPIFLGGIAALLGFFILTPSAMSLLAAVLGYVLIQVQVRLEEDFLLRTHGESYRAYQRVVRRWL